MTLIDTEPFILRKQQIPSKQLVNTKDAVFQTILQEAVQGVELLSVWEPAPSTRRWLASFWQEADGKETFCISLSNNHVYFSQTFWKGNPLLGGHLSLCDSLQLQFRPARMEGWEPAATTGCSCKHPLPLLTHPLLTSSGEWIEILTAIKGS